MRGYIRPKGVGYEVVINLGSMACRRCAECGKRAWSADWPHERCPRRRCGGQLGDVHNERRAWSKTFARNDDAERALAERVDSQHKGKGRPAARKFRDAFEKYVENGGTRQGLRPQTQRRYHDLARLWISPVIGDVALERIEPDHIRSVMRRMEAGGLAARTRQQARAIIRAVLQQAVDDQHLTWNAATATRPPRIERADVGTLRDKHVDAILSAAAESVWEVPLTLKAATGARRSEILAVAWSDIDFDSAEVSFRRSLQVRTERGEDGSTVEFLGLKSDTAARTLPLPPVVIDLMRGHRAAQLERRLVLRDKYRADLDLVCCGLSGEPLYPDSMTSAFKRLARRVGAPAKAHLHDLRHHAAVLWEAEGIETRAISAMLGHASPNTTIALYGRAWDEQKRKAADVMERRLGRVGKRLDSAGS